LIYQQQINLTLAQEIVYFFTEGLFGEIIHYNRALDDDILEYLNREWKAY
jgi:hypothetical protein